MNQDTQMYINDDTDSTEVQTNLKMKIRLV